MNAILNFPHIVKADSEPARLESHPRHRVAQIVMDYLAYGWSPDEICRHHPHLSPGEVHAAMAYYYDHQVEIDLEIQAELDLLDQDHATQPRSRVHLKLRAKGLVR